MSKPEAHRGQGEAAGEPPDAPVIPESVLAPRMVALDVPREHHAGLPSVIVSPLAVENGGGGVLGGRQRKVWADEVAKAAEVVAPVLDDDERVITTSPLLRTAGTWTLILSFGFAAIGTLRRHFLAVTDRRLLLLRHRAKVEPTDAIRVADPLAQVELLNFHAALIKYSPNLVMKIKDARGKKHRLEFTPNFVAEANLVAQLLNDPDAAPRIAAQAGGEPR